jgi:hypothetical protein
MLLPRARNFAVCAVAAVGIAIGWATFAGGAHADDTLYVPRTIDVDRVPAWSIGVITTRTDQTALAPDALRDQLFGVSVARLFSPFEIAAVLSVGPNLWESIDRVRLHGVLLARVGIEIVRADAFTLALRYGLGASLEMRYDDDYWLAHAVPAEASIVLHTGSGVRVELLGALRVAFGGQVVDSIAVDAMGVPEATGQARLDALLGSPLGYAISIAVGREL